MPTKTDSRLLRSVTERVVDSFTSLGMLFTGLDISNSVKLTMPDVRHREIAPLVRELFEEGVMGDYDQTLIDVVADGNKPAQAYLYHLPEQDPTLYDDKMRAQLAIPPVSKSLELNDDPSISPSTTEAPVNVGRDGRGRVPRQLLANAGINDSTVRCTVQRAPDKIVISNQNTPDPGDGSSMLAGSEHPTLLQVPRRQMSIFAPGAKLVARIQGNTVEVTLAP